MIELRHLRYFVAVAEELHFGRAAQRLHMAQPPLSQQIKRLEELLGVQLLKRNRRHVELTDAGRILLAHSRLLLAEVERVAELTRRASDGDSGLLSVGYIGSATYTLLPRIVRLYRERYPDVQLELHELGSRKQLDGLRVGTIDVGLMRDQPQPWLEAVQLREEGVLLALPDSHPLATAPSVALASLALEPFVTVTRDSYFHASVVELCRDAGFAPAIAHEAEDIQSVVTLVSAGLGVAVIPESAASFSRPHVAYVPIEGETFRIPLVLARRRDDESPVAARFAEVAVEAVAAGGADASAPAPPAAATSSRSA